MNDSKEELLSACMDGQLPAGRAGELLDAIENDSDLRAKWSRYHLISDALQSHLPAAGGVDLASSIGKVLESEPAILAPRAMHRNILRPAAGLAIAASVALVAVLTLQNNQPGDVAQPRPVQRVARIEAPQAPLQVRVAAPGSRWDVKEDAVETRLNSYLVNHNERMSYGMQGMLPYIRIVGYDAGR